MPISGKDLPPELFKSILRFLTTRKISDSDVRANKRELGNLSCVCRFWAAHTRGKVFSKITLRSARDLSELLEILDAPGTRVHTYIRTLSIKHIHCVSQEAPYVPWIHLLPPLYQRLPRLAQVIAHLQPPHPPIQGPLRSIHSAVPRSLPATFSARIVCLALSDIHFRCLTDAIRLVGEMPDMRHLQCKRLTWNSVSLSPPRRRSTKGYLAVEVSMTECKDNAACVWLLAAFRHKAEGLPNEWLTAMATLGHSLQSGVKTKPVTLRASFWADHVKLSFTGDSMIKYAGPLLNYSAEWGQSNANTTIRKQVIAISLTFKDVDLERAFDWKEVDWKAFDRTCSHLSNLGGLEVRFSSEAQVSEFLEDVAKPFFKDSSIGGKLRYAFWSEAQNTWQHAPLDI